MLFSVRTHPVLFIEIKLTGIIELADADHNPVVLTLLSSLPKTSTFIQLSGAASVSTASNGLGQLTAKKWSDVADLSEITTFDHSHFHAITDQLVLSEGKKQGIKTAIVVPPVVYGTGQGEPRKTSMVLPWYVDTVKKRGRGFTVGEGKNVTSVIHVRDLSAAFILLVEEALGEGGGKAEWGEKGWYYVDGGEYVFGELVGEIVKAMVGKGLLRGEEVEVLGSEEAKEIHPYAELLGGMNMRVYGERIRVLGWSAKEGDVFESIPELLEG
jgi:nucleoside-diphosphate-sugar epimerase